MPPKSNSSTVKEVSKKNVTKPKKDELQEQIEEVKNSAVTNKKNLPSKNKKDEPKIDDKSLKTKKKSATKDTDELEKNIEVGASEYNEQEINAFDISKISFDSAQEYSDLFNKYNAQFLSISKELSDCNQRRRKIVDILSQIKTKYTENSNDDDEDNIDDIQISDDEDQDIVDNKTKKTSKKQNDELDEQANSDQELLDEKDEIEEPTIDSDQELEPKKVTKNTQKTDTKKKSLETKSKPTKTTTTVPSKQTSNGKKTKKN
ncbi:Hypothetical protein KVN_LOCUS536 [uncultured virus]|nr:Hypothetical protein KVN_LOCUS536 [uncultured virus]